MKIKKFLFPIAIIVCLPLINMLLVSCPAPVPQVKNPENTSNQEEEEDPDPQNILIDQAFWGRWIGSSAVYYISANSLQFDALEKSLIAATSDSIMFEGGTITRESEDILKIHYLTEDTSSYLFRSTGPSGQFSAAVIDSSQEGNISRARGLGDLAGGIGGIDVVIENLDNRDDSQTTETDENGLLTAYETIIGDNYLITIPVQEGVPTEMSAELTPLFDGQELGIFDLFNNSANFKMNLRSNTWNQYLIADNSTEYTLWIEINNIGVASMSEANYKITPVNGLQIVSGSNQDILGTIDPGRRQTVELGVICPEIASDYQNMELEVEITDGSGSRTWTETLSIRFYKNSGQINFELATLDSHVNAVIIDPDGIPSNINIDTGMQSVLSILPWKAGTWTMVVEEIRNVSGPYAIGIDAEDSSDDHETYLYSQLSQFDKVNIDEPNNDPDATAPLNTGELNLQYMSQGDIDFFTFTFEEENNLVYMPNAATSGTVPPSEAYEYGSAAIPAGNPGNLQRSGYFFAGWGTEQGILQANNNDSLPETIIVRSSATTLYAQWLPVAIYINDSLMIKSDGQLWNVNDNETAPIMTDVVSTVELLENRFYLKTDGSLWATGKNESGELGLGHTNFISETDAVKVSDQVEKVISYGGLTLLLTSSQGNMGGNLYGFGKDSGLLKGSTFDSVILDWVLLKENIIDFDFSPYTLYALSNDGTLYGMGKNNRGQLGDGSWNDSEELIIISENVKSFTAGSAYLMYIKNDANKTLWATGRNYQGQLGDGTQVDKNTPVLIKEGVDQVKSVGSSTFIFAENGSLWVCGGNLWGQLGLEDETVETPVKLFPQISSIHSNGNCTFFILPDGNVWASGENNYGRLGIGISDSVKTPYPVQIESSVTTVSTSSKSFDDKTFFLTEGGAVWMVDRYTEDLPEQIYP